MANPAEEELFVIELENAKVLKITGNHEVMTTNGWKAAKDLSVEDTLINI